MRVDYKSIADDDPGGDLETAFQTLSAMTVLVVDQSELNYAKIAERTSFAIAKALSEAVKNKIASNEIPQFIDSILSSNGLDFGNDKIRGFISVLKDTDITPTQKAAVLDANKVTKLKYPNLKMGYLQNAREKRAKGDV